MSSSWASSCVDRLVRGAAAGGGWGYRAGSRLAAEPTALACLALSAHEVGRNACVKALRRLADMQRPEGNVPVSIGLTQPSWTTSLALLAWQRGGNEGEADYTFAIDSAVSWLLDAAGIPVENKPPYLGHDTHLIGWSWGPETHSWVEPTSYAVLALRSAGRAQHARVREGVRLLLDRVVDTGGWNYGNPSVIGRRLRPFPAVTGIALAALQGEPLDDRIQRAVAYLVHVVPSLRAPISLAWAIIGLSAWDARPIEADRLLGRAAERAAGGSSDCLHDALLLLAGADRCPLISTSGRTADV